MVLTDAGTADARTTCASHSGWRSREAALGSSRRHPGAHGADLVVGEPALADFGANPWRPALEDLADFAVARTA